MIEGTRRRTQVFEGVAIKRQGHGARETFTVRKQSFGVGVERTFPLHSPKIERIEVAARGDVRRAKLYYLRDRVGKRARVRERGYVGPEEIVEPGLLHAPEEASDGAVEAQDVEAAVPRRRRRPRPPVTEEASELAGRRRCRRTPTGAAGGGGGAGQRRRSRRGARRSAGAACG